MYELNSFFDLDKFMFQVTKKSKIGKIAFLLS